MKKAIIYGLASLLISSSALAYASDSDQLNSLTTKIEDLQKQVASMNVQDTQSNRMSASMYGQMEEVKNQLKSIRGDIEQLQFDNARINEKLIKVVSDFEFRLSELEKKKKEITPEQSILEHIDENLDNDTILAKNDKNSMDKPAAPTSSTDKPKSDKDFVNKKTQEKSMEAQYQDAYSLLKDKQYKQSQEAFTAFVTAYPSSDLTGSAYYWLGETHFLRAEYDKAAVQYLKGYQSNIRGSRASDNLLKLGKSLAKLEKRKEACITYIKLKKEFPNAQSTIKKQMKEDMKTLRCQP